MNKEIEYFEDLKGEILINIEVKEEYKDELIFTLSNGEKYMLYHAQDCCERVCIESIDGDLNDLLNSEILMAEIVTEEIRSGNEGNGWHEGQWTFYKLATVKGYVTIRWIGESECYSVDVDFMKCDLKNIVEMKLDKSIYKEMGSDKKDFIINVINTKGFQDDKIIEFTISVWSRRFNLNTDIRLTYYIKSDKLILFNFGEFDRATFYKYLYFNELVNRGVLC